MGLLDKGRNASTKTRMLNKLKQYLNRKFFFLQPRKKNQVRNNNRNFRLVSDFFFQWLQLISIKQLYKAYGIKTQFFLYTNTYFRGKFIHAMSIESFAEWTLYAWNGYTR